MFALITLLENTQKINKICNCLAASKKLACLIFFSSHHGQNGAILAINGQNRAILAMMGHKKNQGCEFLRGRQTMANFVEFLHVFNEGV